MLFAKKRLWYAVENGDIKEALALIKEDPDVNAIYYGIENELDLPPLLHALNRSQPIIISSLLDAGADASLTDSQGNNALYYFVKRGLYAYPELAQRLIERGVDINARIDGYTPLYWAMIKMPSFATYLINQGADLETEGFLSGKNSTIVCPTEIIQNRSLSYIALAVEKSDIENFKLLLQKKAPLNKRDSEGLTALMRAILKNDMRLFHDLLQAGADVELKDNHGRQVYDFLKECLEKKKNDILKLQIELQEIQYLLSNRIEQQPLLPAEKELSVSSMRSDRPISWFKRIFFGLFRKIE